MRKIILLLSSVSVVLILLYYSFPYFMEWLDENKTDYTRELATECLKEKNPDFIADFYIYPDNTMPEDLIQRYNDSVDIVNLCRDRFNSESLIGGDYEKLIDSFRPKSAAINLIIDI